MKQFILLLSAIVCIAAARAQTVPIPTIPGAYNYQGIARNAAGAPLANQNITVYSIIRNGTQPSSSPLFFYREKRAVTTNQFGLFSFQIGSPGADSISGTYFTTTVLNALYSIATYSNIVIHTEMVVPGISGRIILPDTKLATVPYAHYALGARPWRYTGSDGPSLPYNTIYPDAPWWNLGLGTDYATEKLHVIGKIRMEDGTQGTGKVLTSNANGVASWITPTGGGNPTPVPNYFSLDQNNVGVGINYLYITDTTRGLSIGRRSGIAGGAGLAVDGPLRFTGNGAVGSVNLIRDGDVLTTDGTGNARWRSLEENPAGAPWAIGASGSIFVPGNVIKPKQGLNLPVVVNTKMVVEPSNSLNGPWEDAKSYPLAVTNPGGTNGISVSLNGGVQHDRKYITFFDNSGVRGRIEGQDLNDLRETPEYITNLTISTLQGAEFAAEAGACAIQVDIAEVVVLTLQIAIWATEFGTNLANLEGSVGITYASGNADYAEWLERANLSDKFTFGDIVSVRGGKISRELSNGGQLMVISRAPIVLGNMPEKGREANYEKVAFIGQVPVKVQGAVAVGDYIVASSNNNGVGYAVHPDKITTEEYSRIVGVAWQASKGNVISMINTAIGINTPAANSIIKKQEEKIALLENGFNQLSAYLQSKDPSYQYTKLEAKPVTTADIATRPLATIETPVNQMNPVAQAFKPFGSMSAAGQMKFADNATKEKIRKLLTEKPQYLDAAMKAVKEKIEANNPNWDTNPQLKRLLNDRAFFIENIKKAYGIV